MRKVPTWQILHRFKRDNIFQITKFSLFVVPLLAAAIEWLRRIAGVDLTIPINLFASYIAALSYFVASLGVDLFCPAYVKQHESLGAFLLDSSPKVKANIEAARDRHELDIDPERIVAGLLKDAHAEIEDELLTTWDRENRSHVVMRLVCSALFVLACGLVCYLALYDAPRHVFLNTFSAHKPPT